MDPPTLTPSLSAPPIPAGMPSSPPHDGSATITDTNTMMMDVDIPGPPSTELDMEAGSLTQMETTPSPIQCSSADGAFGGYDSALDGGSGSGGGTREGSLISGQDGLEDIGVAGYDRGQARSGVANGRHMVGEEGIAREAASGMVERKHIMAGELIKADSACEGDGEGEGEEMRKLMESIELTKKATILQQRLALASFKAQRGWSELTLREIEPKLPPSSPQHSPSIYTSASPIRRRRSRANLSHPSPSGMFHDSNAPPVPSMPRDHTNGNGTGSGSASPTSSRFAPYGNGGSHIGVIGGSRSRSRKPTTSTELGKGYPSSPIRLGFAPSPSRSPHHSVSYADVGGVTGSGPSSSSSSSRTPSRAPEDGIGHRRRSSSSTTLVAAIDLSNHGYAHGREGGPRVVSVSVHGSGGGRRIDSGNGSGSSAGGGRRSGADGNDGDEIGDVTGGRLTKRRRSGSGMVESVDGDLPPLPMPRRPSDSLQSRMLGHRRILSGSSSGGPIVPSSTDFGHPYHPTPPYGKKYRSQSHSTYRTISGAIISGSPAGRNDLATTDEMDVDAANALTSMLGSGPGNSPLRASFAPQFAKPRSQSFALGAGPYESPPRRTPIGLAPAYDGGARPPRSDSAIEEASSDEDKKAAELMIFLAHSPSPIRDRRRDIGHVIPPSMGRVLFEDQLAGKQKSSPVSPEGSGPLTFVSPRAPERDDMGVSLSATSSMDSVDQPTTPPARYDERVGLGPDK